MNKDMQTMHCCKLGFYEYKYVTIILTILLPTDKTHSSSATTRFRKPRALDSALATLGTLHPALGFLNRVVPSTRRLNTI